jgi:hypothetical protein
MREELRTRPDVGSGITVDEADGNVRLVAYEPGNGTRYSLVLTTLGSLKRAEYVLGKSAVLVYVTNFSRGFFLPAGKVHHHFVQERLRCSVFDAVIVAELLGHLLGRECVTVEEFVRSAAG